MAKSTLTLAANLEQLAGKLKSNGTISNEEKYIGLGDKVEEALTHTIRALFPYHFGVSRERFEENEKRTLELMKAYDALTRCLTAVYPDADTASEKALEILDRLPEVKDMLETDIQSAYEGDPAATSTDEIILTYPAFKAISVYRIAHVLYQMKVPMIARIMTEYAHRITGIDIHPGATIGRYFFIDHGTGVVIGETTTIGEHGKLYQHVTLGAKSFETNEDGSLVKGIKRHPDIGNHVVIYAGATILGGTTKIGDNCVVGGNVWLTHSLADGETITTRN